MEEQKDFNMTYELAGTGSGEMKIIQSGTTQYRMSFSYISDALGDMLKATNEIMDGAKNSKFWLCEEPGQYVWLLNAEKQDEIDIEIYWLDDWLGYNPNEWVKANGKKVFSIKVDKSIFFKSVIEICKTLLNLHGLDGYKKLWVEYPFPEKLYKSLQSKI